MDPDVDWSEMWSEARVHQVRLAELVWSYHAALLAAGFSQDQAMEFGLQYQSHLLHLPPAPEFQEGG